MDSSEFIRRIEELIFCRGRVFPAVGINVDNPWLVTVERVPDWAKWASGVLPRANAALTGDGFIFVFATVDRLSAENASNPPYRLAYTVLNTLQVQLANHVAFWRFNNQAFRRLDGIVQAAICHAKRPGVFSDSNWRRSCRLRVCAGLCDRRNARCTARGAALPTSAPWRDAASRGRINLGASWRVRTRLCSRVSSSQRHMGRMGGTAHLPAVSAAMRRDRGSAFETDRARLDALLLDAARAAGAEVLQPCRATGVLRDTRGEIAGLATTGGQVRAKWIADATGRRSWLARELGLAIERHSPRLAVRFGWRDGHRPELDGKPLLKACSGGWDWRAPLGDDRLAWVDLRIPTIGSILPLRVL